MVIPYTFMSYKKSLKICRLLIAVLLFNTLSPVVMASQTMTGGSLDANTTLICTSVGLIRVSLDELTGDAQTQSNEFQDSQHCAYCKLFNDPINLNADNLAYPEPNSVITSNYRSVLSANSPQHVAKHALLRAPPLSFS